MHEASGHARAGDLPSGCFHELSYRRGESLTDWLRRYYNAAHGLIVPTKVPYYILLVGPPTDIPFWFQCELDGQHAVGRLCFEHADQYRKYVDSIIEYDSCGKITNDRTVLFWGTKHEADKATELSSECLISPLAEGTESDPPAAASSSFGSRLFLGERATKHNLLEEWHQSTSRHPATLFFTASHGIGWSKPSQHQLRQQGGLLCNDWSGLGSIRSEHYIAAADIADNARVFGSVAFFFACYGAGTPEYDSFPADGGVKPRPIAERPFVSASAQRLLSHPDGTALAVIGHVDRAWSYSIRPPHIEIELLPYRNMISKILQGQPMGLATRDFRDRALMLSTEMLSQYDPASIRNWDGPRDQLSKWIERTDVQNYILLGDPAVKIRPEVLG